MDYSEALRYIYSFTNFEVTPAGTYSSKTFDLSRIGQLLELLGNPHFNFRSVHVGGTKGKGSTGAMVESVLRTAGISTGFYTSPHLHTFRERIRVNGEMIPKDAVVAGVTKQMPLVEQVMGITTFEVITALAFDYFSASGVDYSVLEVGLGGRLDATNVVTPRISIITSISYDHTGILGNTLEQIAREKAGIIKPSVPVVTSPQKDEALEVIRRIAHEKSAPLTQVTPAWSFQVGAQRYRLVPRVDSLISQTFRIESQTGSSLDLEIPLGGRHQLSNAATALAALFILRDQGVRITDDDITRGLKHVEWRGRLEIFGRSPLMVLDGAHNADSMRHLTGTLVAAKPKSRIHVIFGASADKDINGMFAEILPHAESLVLTRSRNPRAANPLELESIARPYGVEISLAPDLAAAIRDVRTRSNPDDVICVTGSLFVVAEAREHLLKEKGKQVETD